MITPAERVYLVIADLSGYTEYLAVSELEHARDVLADLLDTVVRAIGPVLRLAKLEGDAVFVYAPEADLDASMLLDTLETCYFAFRRRVQSINRATICECNACRRIPTLNLKFCGHHGLVVRHCIAGSEELAGTDVIMVHRLLKNRVADTFGLHGYALLTTSCIERMGINPTALGMRAHLERHDHLGDVPLYVHDLQARWARQEELGRVFVGAEEADLPIPFTFQAPPALVWEYLTSPRKRPLWLKGVTRLQIDTPEGRLGAGSTMHCVHGELSHPEEILDWRPFGYYTWDTHLPVLGEMTSTLALTPVSGGTALQYNTKLKTVAPLEAQEQMRADVLESFAAMGRLMQAELAERDEPEAVRLARVQLAETAGQAREIRTGRDPGLLQN